MVVRELVDHQITVSITSATHLSPRLGKTFEKRLPEKKLALLEGTYCTLKGHIRSSRCLKRQFYIELSSKTTARNPQMSAIRRNWAQLSIINIPTQSWALYKYYTLIITQALLRPHYSAAHVRISVQNPIFMHTYNFFLWFPCGLLIFEVSTNLSLETLI